MPKREPGRARWELLVLLSATVLIGAPLSWSAAVQGPDNMGDDVWWAPVRRESLAAGVCPTGEDLCARGANSDVCRCDAECGKYGDCCMDRSDTSTTGAAETPSVWRCIFESGREFYALASCPDDPAVDPDLLNHCLGKGDQLKPLQNVPVYSAASRIMYANVFCAACHQDLHALRPWKLQLRCNRAWEANTVLEHLARGRYNRMSHSLHGAEGLSCRLKVEDISSKAFWQEVPGTRECRIASSGCWKDAAPRDVELCSSYTAYVYSARTFSNYRNYHCFRCSRNPRGDVECGARPASYGHDTPDVSHVVMGRESNFVNPHQCSNTSTHIYDPLTHDCYETPVLRSDAPVDEPSRAPTDLAGTRVMVLILLVFCAGKINGLFLTRG